MGIGKQNRVPRRKNRLPRVHFVSSPSLLLFIVVLVLPLRMVDNSKKETNKNLEKRFITSFFFNFFSQ